MPGHLNSNPPSGEPVGFEASILIERSAGGVYALLDWADERNAKRQLGDQVWPVESAGACFRLIMADLPGHVFEMHVTEAAPHAAYGFGVEIKPPIGRLVSSHERYTLEPLGADSCRLTLVNSAEFVAGLGPIDRACEVAMMSLACRNALAKLKIHAEQGVEAVRAVKDELFV